MLFPPVHAANTRIFIICVSTIVVADRRYYLKVALAKHAVALRVDAAHGQFVVEADGREVQRLAIKGLGVGTLPFATFVERLGVEARTLRTPIVHHL